MAGIKDITIYDIAEHLQISPATVSRGLKNHPAISKATTKKILDAAKLLGYRSNTFASNLRTNKTNTIGVIVPRLNSVFTSDVLAGMEKAANAAGYNLIISQSLETQKKEILNASTMFNSRVDGLLVSLAYDTKNIAHFEPFIKKKIPLIFFDRVVVHDKCTAVTIDNFKAGLDVATHLLDQGCSNLFHVTGNLSRNVYYERFRGFKQAILEKGLAFTDGNLIINNLRSQDGIEVAKKIISMKNKPDGIFISNDLCAANCMLELKKSGIKIPQEIAFAGFNNDPIASLVEPNLTTIYYKGVEMGEITMQTMINFLNGRVSNNPAQTIILRHELIVRDSSLKHL